MNNINKGIYRHSKGNTYEFVGIASHSETLEPMVVYLALHSENKLWVRPASIQDEKVEVNGENVN